MKTLICNYDAFSAPDLMALHMRSTFGPAWPLLTYKLQRRFVSPDGHGVQVECMELSSGRKSAIVQGNWGPLSIFVPAVTVL